MSRGTPTPLASRFGSYVRGFGVTLAIGLAPFLGKVKLPGFAALLEVVPFQLQNVLIPLSAFLMGLIAVAVQFYAGEEIAASRIRSLFGAGLAALLVGLVLFVVLSFYFVERQVFGSLTVGVIITDSRLSTCRCKKESTNKECISELTPKEEALDSCWGGPSLRRRELSLSMTYLFLTGGFASLIGLLLIQEENRQRRKGGEERPAPATPRRGTKQRNGKGLGKDRPGAGRAGGTRSVDGRQE